MTEAGRRTARSFAVLGLAMAAAAGVWAAVWSETPVDEARPALRRVLEWNGALWHALSSASRESVAPAPPRGRPPRFNGDLGLSGHVDPAAWRMEVGVAAGPAGAGGGAAAPGVDRSAATMAPGAPEGMKSEDEEDDADETPAHPRVPLLHPISISLADLKLLPRTESTAEFRCIEGWSEPMAYSGVRFSDFLRHFKLGARDGGAWDPANLYRYVALETPDRAYYVSIDMDSMLHPQTLLAYEINGAPLDDRNGAPLRLVIPVKYGVKSLKRIGRIYFSDQRPPDYWAEQGYDWFAGL